MWLLVFLSSALFWPHLVLSALFAALASPCSSLAASGGTFGFAVDGVQLGGDAFVGKPESLVVLSTKNV